MEVRTWVVVILSGLILGLLVGRFREEQRVILGALLLSALIGIVVWLLSPRSAAGPSLAVGCALGFLAMFVTRRKTMA